MIFVFFSLNSNLTTNETILWKINYENISIIQKNSLCNFQVLWSVSFFFNHTFPLAKKQVRGNKEVLEECRTMFLFLKDMVMFIVYIFSDETAILKCKVQGNPVPTVKWSKGLREVSSNISVLLATIICHFNVFLKGKGK